MVDEAERCIPLADQARLRPILRSFARLILRDVRVELERASIKAMADTERRILDPEYDVKKRKRTAARRAAKKLGVDLKVLIPARPLTKGIQ